MDIASQLQQLHQLHQSGALNDEEFTRAKQAALNAAVGGPAPKAEEGPSSLRDHILRAAPPPPQPNESKQTAAPEAPPSVFAPVAPKGAVLEPGEKHLYTFGIVPHAHNPGSVFPPRFPGWYWDGTRFNWHQTDRRALIEPYDFGAATDRITKGLAELVKVLGQVHPAGEIAGMAAANTDYEAGQEQLKKMQGQWLALPLAEIVKVEWLDLPFYQLGRLARVVFKNAGVQPLVMTVIAPDSSPLLGGLNRTGDFIAAMAPLLSSGT